MSQQQSLNYMDYYNDFTNNLKKINEKSNKYINLMNTLINFVIIIIVLFFLYEQKNQDNQIFKKYILFALLFILVLILAKIVVIFLFWFLGFASPKMKKLLSIVKDRCDPLIKIPITSLDKFSVTNPNTNRPLDLCIRDFYWPGVYRPYRTINKGKIFDSLYKLNENVGRNFRALSFEVNNKGNNLVIGNSLKLDDTFNIIKKGFQKNLPTILYFELNYGNINSLHEQLYSKILKFFGDKLLFVQQGFVGMGGIYSLPNIPIKETLGKYIIITNKYPTNNLNLNSIINGVMKKDRQYIKKFNYTSSTANRGINYNLVNIKRFIDDNKKFMTIAIPSNMTEVNIADCKKNGIQIALVDMLAYKGYTTNRTYNSLKEWEDSKKSLILKPDNLRYFPPKVFKPVKQNPKLVMNPDTNPVKVQSIYGNFNM